jgi:hypothetical protein
MTRPAPGEDLEAAGPHWKGGVEWSGDWTREVRHWWRLHPHEPIVIHRASGEQVAYIGDLGEPGWHRFEYRHRDVLYPLAVEMKRIWWPNPRAGQHTGPRGDEREPDELRLFLWRVDHLRSADLWRQARKLEDSSDQPPPYWLWRRVDTAIIDAALLWPKKYPSELKAADEVAIEGGWLNGLWRSSFFRRLRHYEDFNQERDRTYLHTRPERAIYCLGLPLTDFHLQVVDAVPPRWERVCGSAFDLYGQKTYRQTLMKNPLLGAALTLSTGSIRSMEQLRWPVLAIAREQTIWSSQVQAYGPRPCGHALSADASIAISSDWTVFLDRYCTIARTSGDPGPVTVSWLDRPVLPFDGMARAEMQSYDPAAITHVLSSYRSWRFAYNCLLNTLPFCPGFAEQDFESDVVLGDCGQLKIVGGFVGGIQRLTTEARLKLELPSDTEATTWSKLFA